MVLSPIQGTIDPRAVAARLRSILGEPEGARLADLGRRLRVGEFTLRRAIHESRPSFDLRVLAAVIFEYGVDPTWLATGEYNARSHEAVESLASREAVHDYLKAATTRDIEMPVETARREA
jgi:hypothetical protein